MTADQHTITELEDYRLEDSAWTAGRNVIVFLGLVSWVACAAGMALDWDRFLRSYLVGFCFWTTIALGALFFVYIQYLTGSGWSVTVRRFLENLTVALPVLGILFLPIAFGLPKLYKWADAAVVAKDHLLQGKAAFLNPNFFLTRAAIYFLIWSVLAWLIHRHSTRQDRDGDARHMNAAAALSAPGMLLTFLTVTFASFDWIMSLDPHWYSTIFGVYVYSGGGWAAMSLLTLIALSFRRAGILTRSINHEHYHDLGKWMFALTVFWAYIAFSQYLLIWYANIPEETIWFKHRMEGNWTIWSLVLLLGHFFFPFLLLLRRASKRNLGLLAFAGVWVLVLHYIDLYWMIMPTFFPHGFELHYLDLASLGAVGSVVAYVFWVQCRQHALYPVRDLRLNQCLAHHNI